MLIIIAIVCWTSIDSKECTKRLNLYPDRESVKVGLCRWNIRTARRRSAARVGKNTRASKPQDRAVVPPQSVRVRKRTAETYFRRVHARVFSAVNYRFFGRAAAATDDIAWRARTAYTMCHGRTSRDENGLNPAEHDRCKSAAADLTTVLIRPV